MESVLPYLTSWKKSRIVQATFCKHVIPDVRGQDCIHFQPVSPDHVQLPAECRPAILQCPNSAFWKKPRYRCVDHSNANRRLHFFPSFVLFHFHPAFIGSPTGILTWKCSNNKINLKHHILLHLGQSRDNSEEYEIKQRVSLFFMIYLFLEQFYWLIFRLEGKKLREELGASIHKSHCNPSAFWLIWSKNNM